jgi:mono/diheme cytochrome c family protein
MDSHSRLIDLLRHVWLKFALSPSRNLILVGFSTIFFQTASIVSPIPAQDEQAMREWGQRFEAKILPLLKSRCLECHGSDDPSGEFDLSPFTDGPAAVAKPVVWEQVGKRIRLNEMPPPGSPQFSDPEKAVIYAWLDSRPQGDDCNKLATDETQAWYKGYVMSRRLTRTEYLNSVRDLLGVTIDDRHEIPSDGAGGVGFDTNGSTLFTSPIHIEQYLAAASDTLNRVLFGGEGIFRQWSEGFDRSVEPREQARELLTAFTRRAWRRPADEQELERLLTLFEFGRQRGVEQGTDPDHQFLSGLHQALCGVLISPNFLFVVERESSAGGIQRLTPYELATRLALFIWSSVPDETLLDAAANAQLDSQQQILSQVHRMLDDPRARALGENFGLQWLGLANFVGQSRPDRELYPDYSPELAEDLREEVVLTIADIFQGNRSLMELIDSNRIWLNGRLAEHYGIPSATPQWQAVEPGDPSRGGVITSGAVLVHTSYPSRTSPVLRGRWLLEEILGSRVPPPPPDVPSLDEVVTQHVASQRERLELHRSNPECAACHDRMDPLGFGLENFDALGRWRDNDQGMPIDATGTLPSGQTFVGAAELKKVLGQRGEEFQRHFVRKLLGFALGRELTRFDDCIIEDSLTALKQNEMQARAVIEVIATSFAFQHRYFKPGE